MTLCRLILPEWRKQEEPSLPKVLEGVFSKKQLREHNKNGYNVYYLPNCPSQYEPSLTLDGTQIDTFNWVFGDMDLKEKVYPTKEAFLEVIANCDIGPTKVVDSGNGIHVYWKVQNLDVMSYLRFQRRIARFLRTDDATSSIFQLMRLPGYINTKKQDVQPLCETLLETEDTYTAEQLDKWLPQITSEDEAKAQAHYAKTYNINQDQTTIDEKLPARFGKLMRENEEAKSLFEGETEDRSKSDFRLGHLMFINDFSREEALSVLINTAKASQRAPVHRRSYALNIVDKIWTFELTSERDKLDLSSSVKDILQKSGGVLKGTRLSCHKRIDNTVHGFRLGQVVGLVGGSGIGKTTFTLNMFRWFAMDNPDYHHFFVPLEQEAREIADRWRTMCGENSNLHEKVHVISNYDDEGNFRNLSFREVQDYIEKFQRVTGNKVGCVVIDHIGALEKGKKDENQDLMTICHAMKAFAVQTNTLLVMQSQTSREKAGIGDLELNKDAAYGTATFEWYCDYLITLWQPLKRCHAEPSCPTVTAYKFCKIREKKKLDVIKEDVPYYASFDSDTEQMTDMTQDQKISFNFFLSKATNKRKSDRKTEILEYKSVPWNEEEKVNEARTDSDRHSTRH